MSMYLYHYFDKRSGPFKSLTALSKDEAFSVLEKIKSDRPSSMTAQRDTGYISKRMNCERIVRQEALNKGILMDISSPHYLVVEHSPWLGTWFEEPGVIKIPIEEFEWARLRASGVTSLGAAFKELNARMSRNGFLNSPSLSFAPVIFLMTDGYPSDDYKAGLNELRNNSWYKFGLKAALGIGSEANDNVLAEFTGSADTVVHAYSGGQLAQMIKIIAVTSSQIGSKSMTLSDDTSHELGEEDVFAAKQKLLGQQIQELVNKADTDDVPFDTGW